MDSNNNRPNPLIARGTVIRILPAQEGVSESDSAWRKGTFAIETEAQYPRIICFNIWDNRIDEFLLAEGDLVEVCSDVESREYMKRWHTDVAAYSVSKVNRIAAAAPEADLFTDKVPYVESAAPSTGFASQAPEADAQNQLGGSFDPAAGDNAGDLPF